MSRLDRRPPRLVVDPAELAIAVQADDDFRLHAGDEIELRVRRSGSRVDHRRASAAAVLDVVGASRMTRKPIPAELRRLDEGRASLRAWDAGWPGKPKAWPKAEKPGK